MFDEWGKIVPHVHTCIKLDAQFLFCPPRVFLQSETVMLRLGEMTMADSCPCCSLLRTLLTSTGFCFQTMLLFSVFGHFFTFPEFLLDPIHDKTVPERALEVLSWLSVLILRLLSEDVLSFLKVEANALLERRLLNTSSTPGPLLKTSLCKSTMMVLRRSWFRYEYRNGLKALEL